MKKIFTVAVFLLFLTTLSAQNVQLHYDLGKDRSYLTSTVEMFRPDKYGSTFFFIDMDYGVGGVEGVSLAYWELARGLKFWDSPFELHLEYNGGFGQFKNSPFNGAYTINDAWLFGGHYTWNSPDFNRIFTLQGMYKNIRGKHDASFQLTGVWTVQMLEGKVTFTGFADFWREDMVFATETTKYVFLAEPQLWYNFCKNFAAGGEVELSSNFGGMQGFNVMPTLGVKYTF